MTTYSLTVDDEIASALGDSPEQIERTMLEWIVLALYRRHDIAAGVAARALGMDRFAFIRWAGEQGIPYFDYTVEEVEAELRAVDNL
jgi:predicted HTH domain antitoxin